MIKTEILLLILIFTIIYFSWKINCLEKKHTEHFAETLTTEAQITRAVKNIYLADVEAIRLLSNFAIQLSQGGYTVPGNTTFGGTTKILGGATVNGIANPSEIDTTKQHTFIVNGKSHFKNDTELNGTTSLTGSTRIYSDLKVDNNLVVAGKPINGLSEGQIAIVGNGTIGSQLHLTNTGKKSDDNIAITWSIFNMGEGYGNRLCFWRYGTGPNWNIGALLSLYDNGTVQVHGNLTVDGTVTALDNTNMRDYGNAGYYFYTAEGSRREAIPIVCTMYYSHGDKNDDSWLIYPRYKVELYSSDGFLNLHLTIDNTSGTKPMYKNLIGSDANKTKSYKVFYNNEYIEQINA